MLIDVRAHAIKDISYESPQPLESMAKGPPPQALIPVEPLRLLWGQPHHHGEQQTASELLGSPVVQGPDGWTDAASPQVT